jgi:hypothetical protein
MSLWCSQMSDFLEPFRIRRFIDISDPVKDGFVT